MSQSTRPVVRNKREFAMVTDIEGSFITITPDSFGSCIQSVRGKSQINGRTIDA